MAMICATVALVLAANSTNYLAVDGLLIGTLRGSSWHGVDHLHPQKISLHFTKFGVGQSDGTWDARGIKKGEPNDELYVDSNDAPQGAIFSGSVRFPRSIKTLSNASSTYVSAMRSFLRSKGISSAARLTRCLSADLDGDGIQEVILEGSSRDNLLNDGMNGYQRGDYSVVLVRFIRNGRVATTPLLYDAAHAKEQLNYLEKIVAIADLDRDGTMEIVTSSSYYEGASYQLFKYRHGKVTKLAEHGDGV